MKADEVDKLNISPYTAHQVTVSRRIITAAAIAGFTIIEVMIVLAIAALIFLVVFLAVPALQRSQRNNARKTDVNKLSTLIISRYANSNRIMPTTADIAAIIIEWGQLGGYPNPMLNGGGTPAASTLSLQTAGVNTPIALVAADSVQIVTNGVCNGAVGTTAGATAGRSMAIQYTLESGGAVGAYCQNVQ